MGPFMQSGATESVTVIEGFEEQPVVDVDPETQEIQDLVYIIIADCDKNNDDALTKSEALRCVKKFKETDDEKFKKLNKWIKSHSMSHDLDGDKSLNAVELTEGFKSYEVWADEFDAFKLAKKQTKNLLSVCDGNIEEKTIGQDQLF